MRKFITFLSLGLFLIIIGCSSNSNNTEFLKKYSGNYLYNEDELAVVHSKDGKLLLNWRGAENIKPLKISNNTFFVKEMNAKIQFLINPKDQKEYLVFIPKNKNDELEFKHIKVANNYKIPSVHLEEKNYEKALEGYLKIKEKDSLNPIISERRFNRLGYRYLRKDSIKRALNIFKLNIALYPESANVYDSYAEGLLKNKDTLEAINYYKKSLTFDSGNRHAKRQLKKLQKEK